MHICTKMDFSKQQSTSNLYWSDNMFKGVTLFCIIIKDVESTTVS